MTEWPPLRPLDWTDDVVIYGVIAAAFGLAWLVTWAVRWWRR